MSEDTAAELGSLAGLVGTWKAQGDRHGARRRPRGAWCFHEELGYWLWDAQAKQVLRCFMVRRGVTVIAGGTAEPDARAFRLTGKPSTLIGVAAWS